LQEGREEWREKGRADVAHNLLKAGVSVDVISSAIGLSLEQIEELKNS
jgi:predicted transposase YdaD